MSASEGAGLIGGLSIAQRDVMVLSICGALMTTSIGVATGTSTVEDLLRVSHSSSRLLSRLGGVDAVSEAILRMTKMVGIDMASLLSQ